MIFFLNESQIVCDKCVLYFKLKNHKPTYEDIDKTVNTIIKGLAALTITYPIILSDNCINRAEFNL